MHPESRDQVINRLSSWRVRVSAPPAYDGRNHVILIPLSRDGFFATCFCQKLCHACIHGELPHPFVLPETLYFPLPLSPMKHGFRISVFFAIKNVSAETPLILSPTHCVLPGTPCVATSRSAKARHRRTRTFPATWGL